MKASQMISQLLALKTKHGDLEVTVTDGYDVRCYSASAGMDFDIQYYEYCDQEFIDIGVGGCLERYHDEFSEDQS